MHITNRKKPIRKGYILCNSKYDIPEKAKLWRQQKDQGLPSVSGKEGWIGGAKRIFWAVKLICIIIQWHTNVIVHLPKPKECTS